MHILTSLATTLSFLALFASESALAQCSALANSPPGTDLELSDDDVRTVGIGFPFSFHGVTYDTISICSNGFLWLGSVNATDHFNLGADFFDNQSDFLAFSPRIAPCWDDWSPNLGGGVFFRTGGGTASIVWKNVPRFGAPSTLANMEVVLHSSGRIFFKYAGNMGIPASTCIVGTSAGGGAPPNPLAWTSFLPGSVLGGTGYQLFGVSAFNLVGQTIVEIPVTPSANDHTAQTTTLSNCAPGSYPALASDPVAYGPGCPVAAVVSPSALYEAFTSGAASNPTDLSGLSIRFVRSGTSYTTMPGPGLDPSYTSGTVVAQFDETVVPGLSVGPMGSFPFATLNVDHFDAAANGYLLLQGGFSDFSPTSAELLAQGARIAPHWTDYDFTVNGTFYWTNDTAAFCMATWEGVEMYGQPGTSNTFQCKLMASGDIIFSYGTVSSALDPVVVGISLGNGAADPGASNLSAALITPVVRDLGQLIAPLTHSASGPASINAPFTLRAINFPFGSAVGVFVLGVTQTNINLNSIGMTGCRALVSQDDPYVVLINGAVMTRSFFIPGFPEFLGVTLRSQAAVLAAVNPAGIIASNGLTWTIGL